MKYFILILNVVFLFGLMTSCRHPATNQSVYMQWAVKMADSDIKRNPEAWMIDFRQTPKWEYTHGLMMSAYMELYKQTGDAQYLSYVIGFAEKFVSEDGSILTYKLTDYNIDRVNPGKFLIELYQITGDEKLLPAINMLREQMRQHPRTTEGGFWHKQVYPHQMWLDGLYMGAPFLAQYAVAFNDSTLLNDVALQYIIVDNNMYNPAIGLYYHGWDESKTQLWANPETGLSPNFWGRSMGWFAMGLVDALSWFPSNHPKRQELIRILQRTADGIIRHQDAETGLWWQVMDQPHREGNNPEATASVMLTYFLIKSVRLGYLDSYFFNFGKKGYDGVLNHLIRTDEDGSISLINCCAVAGLGGNPYRDGSYDYYISEPIRDNDPKGVGPFILASIEMGLLNAED